LENKINLPSRHRLALLQAFLVTFLWSTSYVLVKIGLQEVPALTFSGLRYVLAFLLLLPLAFQPKSRAALGRLRPRQWGLLAVFGLIFYTIVQGANYLGLVYLPVATVGLLLNFTAVFVAILGIVLLSEKPGKSGWLGISVSLVGALVYFYPVDFPASEVIGLMIVAVGVLGNAGSTVLGRYINSREGIPPLVVTAVSMGIGGMLLLGAGGAAEGIPWLSWKIWAIIAWLALVNTAFAFTLWNHTQRTLTAIETSLINNTMLVQIAILAWIFLGESLTLRQCLGMALALLGVVVLQLSRSD
jgi:drug/metabolite transporter (DMT)-like permease